MGWDLHIRKVARAMGISSYYTVLPTATRSACDGFRDNPAGAVQGLPSKKYHRSRNVSRPRRSARRCAYRECHRFRLAKESTTSRSEENSRVEMDTHM